VFAASWMLATDEGKYGQQIGSTSPLARPLSLPEGGSFGSLCCQGVV
jgi:hypothetical protein